MIARPRGTRDVLPDEMEERVRAFGALRRVAALYGYGEVETPTFEHADLFIARSGAEVVEQMYTFEDRGGRILALRPELTAPVARMYSSEMRSWAKPLRLCYFGKCYRYERPQKGRYREFTQFGAELIGDDSTAANADLIAMAAASLGALGLGDIVIRIGDLRVLRALLGDRAGPDVMRLVDKKDPALREVVPDVADLILEPRMDEAREAVGREVTADLERLLSYLEGMGVATVVDIGIARGLDYYNGTVFEADAPSLGAEKQVCGGGSYDLGGVVGIEGLKATGFAIGLDRVLLASGRSGPRVGNLDAYVAPLLEAAMGPALSLSATLRQRGVRTEVGLSPERPAKAIKVALEKGATHVVFIGEEELAAGMVAVRDLAGKEQEALTAGEAVARISRE
ncbi:MAG: histidine--tRNA ligase [Thermoplasmata archaeon]|nr:histidine--tRNA ligase [Thermoplasmata archaeon]